MLESLNAAARGLYNSELRSVSPRVLTEAQPLRGNPVETALRSAQFNGPERTAADLWIGVVSVETGGRVLALAHRTEASAQRDYSATSQADGNHPDAVVHLRRAQDHELRANFLLGRMRGFEPK